MKKSNNFTGNIEDSVPSYFVAIFVDTESENSFSDDGKYVPWVRGV